MSYMSGLILGDNMLFALTSLAVGGSSSGGVYVTYTINADGNILGGSFSQRWIKDPSHVGDYEAYAAIESGVLTTNPTLSGAWVNLGTSQTWALNVPPGGYSDCHFTINIRKVGIPQPLKYGHIRLYGSGLDGGIAPPPAGSSGGSGGGGSGSFNGRIVSF